MKTMTSYLSAFDHHLRQLIKHQSSFKNSALGYLKLKILVLEGKWDCFHVQLDLLNSSRTCVCGNLSSKIFYCQRKVFISWCKSCRRDVFFSVNSTKRLFTPIKNWVIIDWQVLFCTSKWRKNEFVSHPKTSILISF